jgi:RNA polymerase sigma factor for flagellar operon FliA
MRLNAAESDDLFSDLWLRLLAHDGLALRRFRQRARLATYLAAVARNLVLDVRNKHWGKWRPTAAAQRSGATAIRLERLLECDGLTFDEAVEWFAVAEPDVTAQQLRRLAGIARRPGRRQVAVDVLETFASSEPTPYESVARGESAARSLMLRCALESAVTTLSEGDRDLLRWRYLENRTVAEIAAILGTERKPLYRRFERLLSRLRDGLEANGFDATKVMETLGADAEGMQFTVPGPSLPSAVPLQRSA